MGRSSAADEGGGGRGALRSAFGSFEDMQLHLVFTLGSMMLCCMRWSMPFNGAALDDAKRFESGPEVVDPPTLFTFLESAEYELKALLLLADEHEADRAMLLSSKFKSTDLGRCMFDQEDSFLTGSVMELMH